MTKENTIVPSLRIIDEEPSIQHMVGVDEHLRNLRATITTTAYRKAASELGANLPMGAASALFVGPKGVGKTTLAKVYAFELRRSGLVPEKEPIRLIKGSQLIGAYIGHTQDRVNEFADICKEGVGIIDELDAVLESHSYGPAALSALNSRMGDPLNKPIIIGTLYGASLQAVFAANEGLEGRFPHMFRFEGHTNAQTVEVLRGKLEAAGLHITPEAFVRAQETLREVQAAKKNNFANGREVENFVAAIIDIKAHHAMSEGPMPDLKGMSEDKVAALRQRMLMLTEADIPTYNREKRIFEDSARSGAEATPLRPVEKRKVVALRAIEGGGPPLE